MILPMFIFGFSMSALNLNVIAPNNFVSGKPVSIVVKINGSADKADLGVIPPKGFIVSKINIKGLSPLLYSISNEKVRENNMTHIKMNNVKYPVIITITYNNTHNGEIKFILTYKKGNKTDLIFKDIKLMSKTGTICGNGICEPGENSMNCPTDCKITEKTNYISVLVISIIAVAGTGYWLWRRKHVY